MEIERGKGTGTLAGKGVEEEASTEEVVAEVLTEEAGVVLTGVEGVAEGEVGVVEEGLTGEVEEGVVEVLTGE